MVVALRVEINVIAMCILLILIYNNKRFDKNMLDEKLYQILLSISFLYAFNDAMAWLIDGSKNSNMIFSLYLVNILSFILVALIPYIWSIYAYFKICNDENGFKRFSRLLCVPLFFYIIFVVLTPIHGLMFTFDENKMYHRGTLIFIQFIFTFIYLVLPTFLAISKYHKTNSVIEKKEYINIASFIILPLIGIIIQVLFYGIPSAIIAVVLSELLIFINVQNKQISLDALTKLNNRGQLNRYLIIQSKKENHSFYLLFLDIDFFKNINDDFGHSEGDQALIDMSKILQEVCGKEGCFLSRYGGDEFAIVIEKTNEEVLALIKEINKKVEYFNNESNRKYKLSISVGYAEYIYNESGSIDKLIEKADYKMYEMKKNRHIHR